MGLSEYQRGLSLVEFRRVLQSAYDAGFGFGRLYECQGDWHEDSFEEWFEKNFGDILDVGDISPGDEKTVWEDENGPLY
jgi:hypothetical protein